MGWQRKDQKLFKFCTILYENEIEIIEHLKIDPEKHLDNSKIHLNRYGDHILENNLFMGCRKHSD